MLHVPEQTEQNMRMAELIKELPPGAVQSWGQIEELLKPTQQPIYLFIVNITGDNPLLQFKRPFDQLHIAQGALFYAATNERIAVEKYFNRSFLPTFFVFDNYMHALALEMRLKQIGCVVNYRKYQ